MKKALLLVIGIVAVCFLIANADYLASFLATLKTGALVPLVVACVLMLARHLVQAASYDAAFEAVGHKTGFWHNVVLIFSLVFINTFCLFSGATGVAFIIDDAHRTGADAGTSTSGAILSQIGYFAAILVISVIGFLTMLLSGSMNTLFLVGGLALAAVLAALSSMFVVGYRKPRVLFRLFIGIESLINKALGLLKKHLKPAWGRKMASSFISSAGILAKNPQGTMVTVSYASFSAILNMACLVAIGYAFGFENVAALVAAFAVAAISVILSPTPQGVGVVEAAIAAILTAHGCSLATATAIALVYRGIMFWIPFCIGALLLSQSGFFADKKSPTEEKRAKDTAWVSGTIVLIVGLVNIGMALIPQTFRPFTALTDWINMGGLLIVPYRGEHRARGAGRGTHPALPYGVGAHVGRARAGGWRGVPLREHRAGCRGGSAAGDVAVLEARRVRPSYRSARRRAAPRARVPRERRAVPRLARQAGCGEGSG